MQRVVRQTSGLNRPEDRADNRQSGGKHVESFGQVKGHLQKKQVQLENSGKGGCCSRPRCVCGLRASACTRVDGRLIPSTRACRISVHPPRMYSCPRRLPGVSSTFAVSSPRQKVSPRGVVITLPPCFSHSPEIRLFRRL